MKLVFFIVIVLICNEFSFSQIVSGKKKAKKNKASSEFVKPAEDNEKTLVSVQYAYGNSFRILKQNGDFYGDSLGERSLETKLPRSGVYLGFNGNLRKNMYFDFGMGYQQFGEQYSKDLIDSTISYQNKYAHLLIPFKIQYRKGNDFQFFISTGFQAQLALNYSTSITITKGGSSSTEESTITYNKSSFTIASTSSLGFQMRFSPRSCLIVSGDFIQQLTSSYNKQAPFVHKSNFYGFKIGLGFKI